MSGPEPSRSLPRWLAPAVVVLLGLQVVLLYVQGAQLHQQRGELRALREDVRDLAEALDEAVYAEEGSYRPSRQSRQLPKRLPSKGGTFQRVILEEDPEPAARELEASRKEAQKSVEKARDTQEKLSIEANAKKAEEKAKVEAEKHKWGRYAGLGLGLVLLALVFRSLLRRS